MEKTIVLASASERRSAILENLQIPFIQRPSAVDETLIKHSNPVKLVENLAKLKASAILETCHFNQIILAADTVVVKNRMILGKPQNEQDVYDYLNQLSGKCHAVLTGIALIDIHENHDPKWFVAHHKTLVRFKKLTHRDIAAYIETQEPFDKAGAYGIQGFGGTFVKWIKGDYFNVVGLPVSTLMQGLSHFGYHYFTDIKR